METVKVFNLIDNGRKSPPLVAWITQYAFTRPKFETLAYGWSLELICKIINSCTRVAHMFVFLVRILHLCVVMYWLPIHASRLVPCTLCMIQ